MIILKIIGIVLAAIVVLIALLLSLRFDLLISYSKENGLTVLYKYLFITFGKNPNPNNPIVKRIKRILDIDKIENIDVIKQDVEESGVSEAIKRITTIITLLAGRIFWLLKHLKIKKLRLFAVCADDDAADAAIDYGLACAAVYPLIGFITSNIKTAKNSQDVGIYCDFEGESKLEVDITVSVRVIHLIRALYHNMMEKAETIITEEAGS